MRVCDADDARDGQIDANCDRSKGARGKGNDINDDGGLCNGLSLDFVDQFHLPRASGVEKN